MPPLSSDFDQQMMRRAIRLAMKLEPMRAAASTPNEVARTILNAAVHGLTTLARP